MDPICEALQLLSAAALGLFAGAMLTEGFVLVPYWRSLSAPDFFRWYAANDRRLVGFFGALTAASAALALAAAAASVASGDGARLPAVLAALLVLAALGMFFLYFRQANVRFAAASVDAQRLPEELARWASWHRARTGLALAALCAGMLAAA